MIRNALFTSAILSIALFGCATDDPVEGTEGPSTADPTTQTTTQVVTTPPVTGTTGTTASAQVFDDCLNQDFTLQTPSPYTPWTPLAVTLVSEELSPGVFAIYDENAAAHGPLGYPLATSGGFVIGDDGVLIVETMINRQLLCQVVDLVADQTDKPVLYAVNTSYHGDHSYGNAFLADDVEIVQHQRTADFIADHFDADKDFMITNFGADQGIEEVTATEADILVTDTGWSVDLGGITVEANYHGFGQTEGDLFVWVPSAKVLWTGNPLVAEAPAIPWLLDGHAHDVELTLGAVRDTLPEGSVVIPGHGQPLGNDAFDFHIDYLSALQAEVQVAVDDGLDMYGAIYAVEMVDYQGYALWDWVHSWVNVPATHAELSAN